MLLVQLKNLLMALIELVWTFLPGKKCTRNNTKMHSFCSKATKNILIWQRAFTLTFETLLYKHCF